jgi:choline dehydrogenase-like flavoprotein
MRTTVISAQNPGQADDEDSRLPDFAERVRLNQRKLSSDLKPQYEIIICGSGFSGSLAARRLAEKPDVSVLLLEAGSWDDVPNVMEAGKWPLNQERKRNYGFPGQPSFYLNGYCHESEAGLADKVLSGESAPGSLAARHLLVVSRNYGVDNLRIADGSILPRVTTGNTMALRHHRRTGRRDAEGGA